jgi:hypothetical protein
VPLILVFSKSRNCQTLFPRSNLLWLAVGASKKQTSSPKFENKVYNPQSLLLSGVE